ncbi:hypothetical protein HPB52_014492 [Rhipicephalus sanguineus]|uniref:Sulfotransferase domain-containing protein n=1 Tax=Rhipicephalus sanguineus TaxID=34632 RepID=A0A9D4PZ44_RHISA|nr:hypothetical protein HPB52_014492 [Rhipicephalus sanguineus]
MLGSAQQKQVVTPGSNLQEYALLVLSGIPQRPAGMVMDGGDCDLQREHGEGAKFVYVARNPWDVCVSFYHMVKDLSVFRFQDGTFDDFLEAFLAGGFGFGSYFQHVASGLGK